MKRAFMKALFVILVLLSLMVLAVPSMYALDLAFPAVRGSDGLYRSGDKMWLMMIPLFACAWVANRLVSSLFWYVGLSEERRSVLQRSR